MGVSTRNLQVHTSTSSDFYETYRICRALGGDLFRDKIFYGKNKTKYLTLRTRDGSNGTPSGFKMMNIDYRDRIHES